MNYELLVDGLLVNYELWIENWVEFLVFIWEKLARGLFILKFFFYICHKSPKKYILP